jgi:hypothetical protein
VTEVPAELLRVGARQQLAFVEGLYHVEEELVGAVGDLGRGAHEGAQLLDHERHQDKERQRDQPDQGQHRNQDGEPPRHEVRERPHREREHDGERYPPERHDRYGGGRV